MPEGKDAVQSDLKVAGVQEKCLHDYITREKELHRHLQTLRLDCRGFGDVLILGIVGRQHG